jgi:hypothetical protein
VEVYIIDDAEYVEIALQLGGAPAYRSQISAQISQACPVLFEDTGIATELADLF